MNGGHGRSVGALALAVLVGLGPAPLALASDDDVEALLPKGEIPEEQRLDIAIDLFSPSIDDHDRETLTEKGIQPSVRKAEARFLPTHLRNTLQSTGQWGAVRVVPGGVPWAELSIVGKIETSHGKELKVRIVAWDATGRNWLDDDYRREAKVLSYAAENVDGLDPFQGLYNEIANDLVKAREKRKKKDLVRIRDVARLRFAAEFAPDTFGPYLESDKKGRYEVVRLPDESDPMLVRLGLIRERDDMFVDTLNEYYSDFYARMGKPYGDWRANSYTEQAAYDALNNKKWGKLIGGAVAVIGGILLPAHNRGTGMAKDVAVLGGIAAVQSGLQDGAELEMHKAALEELAESFGADVTELVVDVDGKTVELTGSAEAQFEQWRALLRQIARTDASLPEDINVTSAPAPVTEPTAAEPTSPAPLGEPGVPAVVVTPLQGP
ncbi:MAG: hypothetical protein LJF30_09905 [Acidobacteria bacterium]|nr:hypothetical protein [Acidobacteriota bacterium]